MKERLRRIAVLAPMARKLILLSLLLVACSKGPDADLQYISEARSAASEWALINEKASEGKLNATYVTSMHEWLRNDIETSMNSLTRKDAPYAQEMAALLEQQDDAPAEALRAHADKLKQIEDSLESA